MKASALHILQGMEIPEYARGVQELWTVKGVREALVDAYRLLRATGGRAGPKSMAAYWPEFQNNPEDYPEEKTKTSPYHTRMTTTRMEMVLMGWRDADGQGHPGWLQGPLLDMPEKAKLEEWIFAELRGEPDEELCERKGWSRATFKRHRDRAAGTIAHRLNLANIEVW